MVLYKLNEINKIISLVIDLIIDSLLVIENIVYKVLIGYVYIIRNRNLQVRVSETERYKKRPEGLYDYTILSSALTNTGRLLLLV